MDLTAVLMLVLLFQDLVLIAVVRSMREHMQRTGPWLARCWLLLMIGLTILIASRVFIVLFRTVESVRAPEVDVIVNAILPNIRTAFMLAAASAGYMHMHSKRKGRA